MAAGLGTPMLDFFRRGEVARDVRLLAAQGAIAPRPLEQLGLLMLLTPDHDAEVQTDRRSDAEQAAAGRRWPVFIARADVPTELREFFITPRHPAVGDAVRRTTTSRLSTPMRPTRPRIGRRQNAADVPGAPGRHDRARKSEVRHEGHARDARDPDSRPQPDRGVRGAQLPEGQRAGSRDLCEDGNVSEDILRTIATTRAWTKNYGVMLGLVKNSKTPVALTLNLMQRLNDRDVKSGFDRPERAGGAAARGPEEGRDFAEVGGASPARAGSRRWPPSIPIASATGRPCRPRPSRAPPRSAASSTNRSPGRGRSGSWPWWRRNRAA